MCHRATDLARHERFPSSRRFVIEKDACGGVHAVALAIIHHDGMRVQLGARVRAAWPKLRELALRSRCAPEHLAGRSLVEAARDSRTPDRFPQPHRAPIGGGGWS